MCIFKGITATLFCIFFQPNSLFSMETYETEDLIRDIAYYHKLYTTNPTGHVAFQFLFECGSHHSLSKEDETLALVIIRKLEDSLRAIAYATTDTHAKPTSYWMPYNHLQGHHFADDAVNMYTDAFSHLYLGIVLNGCSNNSDNDHLDEAIEYYSAVNISYRDWLVNLRKFATACKPLHFKSDEEIHNLIQTTNKQLIEKLMLNMENYDRLLSIAKNHTLPPQSQALLELYLKYVDISFSKM